MGVGGWRLWYTLVGVYLGDEEVMRGCGGTVE